MELYDSVADQQPYAFVIEATFGNVSGFFEKLALIF